MMDGMGHDHDHHHMSYAHMTLFWGSKSEIFISGFPGDSIGTYFVVLVLVFMSSAFTEYLNHCTLTFPEWCGVVTARLMETAMHAFRIWLAYMVMLAVMSFNVGVLITAIAGHAVGFFLLVGGPLVRGSKGSVFRGC